MATLPVTENPPPRPSPRQAGSFSVAMKTHYETLGVPESANLDTLRQAYLELARQVHPDQHPGAGTALQASLQEAMVRVNEAWTVLEDPGQRQRYDASLRRSRTQPPPPAPPYQPGGDECLLCAHSPAELFEFQYQKAFLLFSSKFTATNTLCQSCAQSVGRSTQNRTLWLGWWGIFAFFRNIGAVYTNGKSLRQAAKMKEPTRSGRFGAAPLLGPLGTGRPVLARSGVWFTALALLFAMSHISEATSPQTPSVTRNQADWAAGNCVSGSTYVTPVRCSQPHSGRIAASALNARNCPLHTEFWVEDGAIVWCIDADG